MDQIRVVEQTERTKFLVREEIVLVDEVYERLARREGDASTELLFLRHGGECVEGAWNPVQVALEHLGELGDVRARDVRSLTCDHSLQSYRAGFLRECIR